MSLKWRKEEDDLLLLAIKHKATVEEARQALQESFGRSFSLGMVDGRMYRLQQSENPITRLYGDCEIYFLSASVPWVPQETREQIDLLQRQKSLPVPA